MFTSIAPTSSCHCLPPRLTNMSRGGGQSCTSTTWNNNNNNNNARVVCMYLGQPAVTSVAVPWGREQRGRHYISRSTPNIYASAPESINKHLGSRFTPHNLPLTFIQREKTRFEFDVEAFIPGRSRTHAVLGVFTTHDSPDSVSQTFQSRGSLYVCRWFCTY